MVRVTHGHKSDKYVVSKKKRRKSCVCRYKNNETDAEPVAREVSRLWDTRKANRFLNHERRARILKEEQKDHGPTPARGDRGWMGKTDAHQNCSSRVIWVPKRGKEIRSGSCLRCKLSFYLLTLFLYTGIGRCNGGT
ncbi:hypothetical protein EVAR_103400_1 [Eumeta japonica]|uniref:Uncharacterized protein n=1 Tax=Eumeta variegata TaxID=151549 RepID=A0A4C1YW10_EUMVA|nr:hypothetical protein EVAR_103400_1 [Eumeta japonica]